LARRQRQSVTVRALARAMLCAETGLPAGLWRFEKGPHGAPIGAVSGAVARALSFAHSAAMVGCTVAEHGPIGLDVEHIRADRPILDLARAAFGPAEVSDVEAHGISSFYRIWVLREAMAKATGQGFALLVNQMDLVLPGIDDGPGRLRFGPILWRTGSWTTDDGYAIGCVQRDPSEGGGAIPAPRLFRLADLRESCANRAD
jgi:hypothetical protein